MAEPAASSAGATFLASSAFGTVGITFLSAIGVDVQVMSAALLGCVVVQTLLPAEAFELRRVVLTTVGSIVFASLAAPWLAPSLATMAPKGMAYEHVQATAAAVVAAFPKPLLRWVARTWRGFTDEGGRSGKRA